MGTVSFQEMPIVVKVAAGVAFFTAWMCLEEFVINRSGFWRYMPYYKRMTPASGISRWLY